VLRPVSQEDGLPPEDPLFPAVPGPVLGGLLCWLVLAGPAPAQVIVTPRCVPLQAGQTWIFQARPADPEADPGPGWRWTLPDPGGGSIHEDTGAYTAPDLPVAAQVRVRAARRDDPGRFGEATVTVLPAQPFDLIGKVLGPGWLEAWSGDLPSLDLATGKRFPAPGPVAPAHLPLALPKAFRAGFGLPCTLRWTARPGAQAELLSIREGTEVTRLDVTGRDTHEAVFRSPVHDCTVEALAAKAQGGWESRLQRLQVDVRGLFPFTGNPLAEEGHQDGPGLSARFREAFDAVRVPVIDCCGRVGWGLVVTDPAGHVLRRVAPDGRVATFCGRAGRAGHRDSPGLLHSLAAFVCRTGTRPPRFHRPTYLARRDRPETPDAPSWDILVSDTGNHVIRRVLADGRVETLAGAPGQPGHRDDGDPRQARFDDPRGLAVDDRGNAYVADRGNFVVRRIDVQGRVITLAGSPGQPGTRDGFQEAARFTDLKGLDWLSGPDTGPLGTLFVLDGHALRAIHLPLGEVETVLGQVDAPGFRDLGPFEALGQTALVPCLNGPVGVRALDGSLLVADRGNHAVRKLNRATFTLSTLAGDPQCPETRWGLLRDGVPGPLDSDYAALEAPTAVATGPQGPRVSLLVCTGRSLVELRHGLQDRDLPGVFDLACTPVRPQEPCTVSFRVPVADAANHPVTRPVRWRVDFLDPDGSLAERQEGQGASFDPQAAQGAFTQAGEAAEVVRCVTDQGVSAGARVAVTVADG
jgi:hypothetical protein